MFAYIVCISLLAKQCLCGDTCGTKDTSIPQLSVQVFDSSNAGTDDKIAASILVDGEWTPWYRIDHSGCDNFDRGMTNYFDEFESYTSEWEAIALYNCGTDGLEIDAIGYWNGVDSTSVVDFFCFNVAGPFEEDCFVDLDELPNGECYEGEAGDYYNGVWIDQNNAGCQGIQFYTGRSLVGDEGVLVGAAYFLSTPGTPSCSNLLADETELVAAKSLFVGQSIANLHWFVYASLLALFVFAVYKMYQKRSSVACKTSAGEDTEYVALKTQIQK